MILVGETLLKVAGERQEIDEIDLFVRSAMNRFYYAAYWSARSFVGSYWQHSKALNHTDLPIFIYANCVKVLKPMNPDPLDKADIERESLNIKLVLQNAYKVRCIADYNPEMTVTKVNDDYQLQVTTTAVALSWHDQVKNSTTNIRRIYKQYGL